MAIDSSNLFEENPDMQFHLQEMVDWNTVIPLREQDFKDYKIYQETGDETFAYAFGTVEEGKEMYATILSGLGELASKEFLKNARLIEEEGFKLKDGQVIFPAAMKKNVQVLTENGYMGLLLPRKYGGMQIPNTANMMATELVSTGDIGLGTLPATQDLGDIIYKFGTEEQHKKYLPKIASGEMGAAMLLTEPNYGSDLQNAQTKGDVAADGSAKVTGTKMWITHGAPHSEGGQVYLTVTRTVKKPDGSFKSGGGGLSLVLTHSKDADIVSLEHKLGIHSSPTVQLSLDNSPGELVGVEGRGLIEYTMALMNAARLTVAAQSVGASQIALREAQKYANERVQFGVLIKEIPAVAKMLEEMEISTEASRALVYKTAQVVDIYEGLEEKFMHQGMSKKEAQKTDEYVKYSKLAKVLTPFSKLYAAEEANRNAYRGVQVFGGVGYSEEFDIARIYRDARILSIYEGTSQLQVVAAIGGVLEGYSKDNSTFLEYQKSLRASLTLEDCMKSYLSRVIKGEQIIKEMVAEFKNKSTDFKGKYAVNVVWSAILVFNSHLFLQMAVKNPDMKKRKAQIFINEMLAYVKNTSELLTLQGELDKPDKTE